MRKILTPFDMSDEWRSLFLKGLVVNSKDCWIRTRGLCRGGYTQRKYKGKLMFSHRLSWALVNGPIPAGEGYHGTCVLHKCDARACVKPDHLFLGTNLENVADRVEKKRSWRPMGEKHHLVKLKTPQVIEIRKQAALGFSHSKIASVYGVCRSTVSYIVSGELWPSVSEGL